MAREPSRTDSGQSPDDSSHELSELGRLEFGKADTAGKLLKHPNPFDPSISAEAYQLAQQFISGNTAPEISRASFDSDLIQGALHQRQQHNPAQPAIRQDTATVQQLAGKSRAIGSMIKPMASTVVIPRG